MKGSILYTQFCILSFPGQLATYPDNNFTVIQTLLITSHCSTLHLCADVPQLVQSVPFG